MFRHAITLGAVASLATAPLAAQDMSGTARTSAPVAGDSEMGGGQGSGILPAVIIAALAGLGMAFLLLTDDDDNDIPVSP